MEAERKKKISLNPSDGGETFHREKTQMCDWNAHERQH